MLATVPNGTIANGIYATMGVWAVCPHNHSFFSNPAASSSRWGHMPGAEAEAKAADADNAADVWRLDTASRLHCGGSLNSGCGLPSCTERIGWAVLEAIKTHLSEKTEMGRINSFGLKLL